MTKGIKMYAELLRDFAWACGISHKKEGGLMCQIWQKRNMKEQILGFRIFATHLYLITKTYFPLFSSQIPRI